MDHGNNEDDIDGDGLDDDDLSQDDIDGDNSSDAVDADIDGDGLDNSALTDDDIDGDGKLNGDDDEDDTDGDGYKNREDGDDDNDGTPDEDDDDHDDEIDEVRLHENLINTASAPASSEARVSIKRMATGLVELKVDIGDFNPGTYNIVIGGVNHGTIVMSGSSGKASGERKFKTGGSGEFLPLDFEVIAQPISIELSGTTYFNGTIPTPPDPPPPGETGGEPPVTSTAKQALSTGPGISGGAKAEVLVDFGLAGVIEVEFSAESIPAGTYQIAIDGVTRGTLVIALHGAVLSGYRHFEVIPDEPGELLLDFPASGKPVVISQGGVVWFSGIIPTAE